MALPMRVWDGTQWIDVGVGAGQVYYSNTEPASGSTGDLWVDSDGTGASLDPDDFLTNASASVTYATKAELGGAGLNPFFLPGL